jgi:nucleoside-diphosphate-sugar epimerase
MRGRPLTVFGGEQWRPILHVRDAARAIVNAALINEIPNNVAPGIYNIAERDITIRELAETVRDVAPVSPKPIIEYSEISFEDARNYRVDNSKYKRQPGAVPFKITLEESVLEMMGLIRDRRIKDPFAKDFHNARFLEDFVFHVDRI